MKKNSKNKKGMTLVEVIIAMALLSGMSAMLVLSLIHISEPTRRS